MDFVSAITTVAKKAEPIVSRAIGDKDAFDDALKAVREKIKGRRDVINGVLNKNNLSAALENESFSFKWGYQAAGEVTAALDQARAGLPSSYKNQVGVGLMAMGQGGSSVNSMLAGASLMNCGSSAEALREIFGSLGAARAHLKLDRSALAGLGQVLADSGLGQEEIDAFLTEAAAGSMAVDDIYAQLEKLDLKAKGNKGLVATEAGLATFGQILSGLGASPEVVDSLTSSCREGDSISASDLRRLITANDEGLMSANFSEADVQKLGDMLKSMGAGQRGLDSLSTLMAQNKGQISMNDFFNFMDSLETSSAKSVTGQELQAVKNILENISREQELAKLPVFNEILTKLQVLGDQEVDEEFIKLSPALQALRGGVSGTSQNMPFSGHNDQSGGQGRNGHQQGQDPKDRFRQDIAAANSDSSQAAVAETAEKVQSYGGQESLVRQITQKIAYSHRRGIHRLKMNLDTMDLGRLDIELKVDGDRLVAHIRAEDRATYEALADEIDGLKTALAESGLELSNVTLAFDGQGDGQAEFADLSGLKSQTPAADEYGFAEPAGDAQPGSVYRVI